MLISVDLKNVAKLMNVYHRVRNKLIEPTCNRHQILLCKQGIPIFIASLRLIRRPYIACFFIPHQFYFGLIKLILEETNTNIIMIIYPAVSVKHETNSVECVLFLTQSLSKLDYMKEVNLGACALKTPRQENSHGLHGGKMQFGECNWRWEFNRQSKHLPLKLNHLLLEKAFYKTTIRIYLAAIFLLELPLFH